MEFYQNQITQKSWQILKNLKGKFDFILIGGWAVWLYTKALKSKDIDIIVNYDALSFLKENFEVNKNGRLKKYEAKMGGIDIDVYLPFYSHPGLPPEIIQKYLASKENFKVPRPEVLLILKQFVYEIRKASVKGQKDKIDIFSLLRLPLDWVFYQKILKEAGQEKLAANLKTILKTTLRVKELDLKNHQMAKLKKEVLAQIS